MESALKGRDKWKTEQPCSMISPVYFAPLGLASSPSGSGSQGVAHGLTYVALSGPRKLQLAKVLQIFHRFFRKSAFLAGQMRAKKRTT